MYVDHLKEFASQGTFEVESPTWVRVEAAIRSLDGRDRTGMLLRNGKDGSEFGVAGGGGNRYYVFVMLPGFEVFDLVEPDGRDEEVTMRCFGEPAEFIDSQLTDLPTAIAAAKSFAEQGQLINNVRWKSRGSSRR